MIPHVTDEIKRWIEDVGKIPVDKEKKLVPKVVLVELGGTVGDIESTIYYEAVR
jgi:CTP synthase